MRAGTSWGFKTSHCPRKVIDAQGIITETLRGLPNVTMTTSRSVGRSLRGNPSSLHPSHE